jgi:hypothetical protein
VCLLMSSGDLQKFAAVTHLVEGISLEALLTLKVEISLICLVATREPKCMHSTRTVLVRACSPDGEEEKRV